MIYPKLYSRTNTGAIQTWELEVEGNKYRARFGQLDGKIQIGEWTLCKGKNANKSNATTDEIQALKEADAEFLKKKSQKGYFEKIEDIDTKTFFEPQLAKQWEEYKDDIDLSSGDWCISPKLDGVRVIENNQGAFSRNGKKFLSFPHIHSLLDSFFRKYPDLILDGECYQHAFKDNFNKIISLAKKTKPTQEDLIESKNLLEYWVFDSGSLNEPFIKRLEYIRQIVIEVNDPRIKLVEHEVVTTESQVNSKLQLYLEQGFEGAMLKKLSAYYSNKRTKNCLKYKLFQDQEFQILDIIEGAGNRSGKFGRALLKTLDGVEFESNARGDDEYYKELLYNKNRYINKMATVRFQNWTPEPRRVPRFPVIIGIRNYE